MYANPYLFGSTHLQGALQNNGPHVFWTLQMTLLYPGFAILMMRALNLVNNLEMPERQQRYGPYIATGICYLWNFVNMQHGHSPFPEIYIGFTLGATIGLFAAFFLNIFTKVSAHAVGMGGFVGMLLLLYPMSYHDIVNISLLLIVCAGAVGTSRMILGAHQPQEVYGGYLVGFGCQMLAAALV
jgi:membrane-associated phospholipid phosphatase